MREGGAFNDICLDEREGGAFNDIFVDVCGETETVKTT